MSTEECNWKRPPVCPIPTDMDLVSFEFFGGILPMFQLDNKLSLSVEEELLP